MTENIYSIYLIVNKINNKKYIGFTSLTMEERWKIHIKLSKRKINLPLFHKAIKKYGKENFACEIIYQSKDKSYTINEMEPFFIENFNSHFLNGWGYNMTLGGENPPGMKGKIFSEEHRKKLSKAKSKEKHHFWRKQFSKEHLQNLSNATKGKNNPMYGKTHTQETKRKMSKMKSGKFLSEKHKKNLKEAKKNSVNIGKCYKIIIFDIETNIKNLSKFCRNNNLSINAVKQQIHKKGVYYKNKIKIIPF